MKFFPGEQPNLVLGAKPALHAGVVFLSLTLEDLIVIIFSYRSLADTQCDSGFRGTTQ